MSLSKYSKFWKNKKVLITGNTGFKGAWLTQILSLFGAKIYGLSISVPTTPSLFEILNHKEKIQTFFCDIRNASNVNSVIKKVKPDFIFHLAAQSLVSESYINPRYTFETNIIGTFNVLEAANNNLKNSKVIIVTSDKCYKNLNIFKRYKEGDELGGNDPYSASKAMAEMITHSMRNSFKSLNGTKIATVRAGNVIGGGDWSSNRLVPDIICSIFKKQKLVIRNPKMVRPWQHVLEPLFGYIMVAQKLSLKNSSSYENEWNFGPNKSSEVNVKNLVEIFGNYHPIPNIIFSKTMLFHEEKYLALSSSKAKNKIKWFPKLTLKDSVKYTYEWYDAFYNGIEIHNTTNNQIISYLTK